MQIELFSDKYKVHTLTNKNIDEIYNLQSQNVLFYEYCPPFVTRQARRLYKVGRSSLSFELPLSFEQAAAYRKANGQYVRKNQWRETNVTVYIGID